MYKYQNSISGIRNVDEFLISENNIIFLLHKEPNFTEIVSVNSIGSQIWRKKIEGDIEKFEIYSGQLFIRMFQVGVLILDLNNGKEVSFWNIIGQFNKTISKNICLFDCKNLSGRYTPTLFKDSNKVWQLSNSVNYRYLNRESNFIVGFSRYDEWDCSDLTFLQKDSLETGETLWHFNLKSLHQEYDLFSEKWNKPMEIANFCGVANEVLWMDVVCRGIGNFLLGLDVNTGQPIHLLDKAENRFMVYPFNMIPTDGRTTYDAKRNILFGFAPDWVHWQVDLSEKSPKITMWDLSEEMAKHRTYYVSAYMNCGISDSHIFFPVGSLGSTPQVFALNRETLKVDWQYNFIEGGQYFTPTKIEVTNTHLYVLDNTGTLHIFEKTEDN
jgi:outer membrane protein assembly factor BamB